MRVILVAALAAMLIQPAHGQTNRFSPDNGWWTDFEATCRLEGQDPPIEPDCANGVLEGWAATTGYTNGQCDWEWFWATADTLKRQRELFEVMPWQYAVEQIFEHGACEGYTDNGDGTVTAN